MGRPALREVSVREDGLGRPTCLLRTVCAWAGKEVVYGVQFQARKRSRQGP